MQAFLEMWVCTIVEKKSIEFFKFADFLTYHGCKGIFGNSSSFEDA